MFKERQVVNKPRADGSYLGQDFVNAGIARAVEAWNGNPIPPLDPLTDPHANVASHDLNPDHVSTSYQCADRDWGGFEP